MSSLCLHDIDYMSDVVYSAMLAAVKSEPDDVKSWGRWLSPEAWFPSIRKTESCAEPSETSQPSETSDCQITGHSSREERDARGRENAVVLDSRLRRRVSFEEKRLDSLAAALNDHLKRCMSYADDEDDQSACVLAMTATCISVQRVRRELKRIRDREIAARTATFVEQRKRQRYRSHLERVDGEGNGVSSNAERETVGEAKVGDVPRDDDLGGAGSHDGREGHHVRHVDGSWCDSAESGDSGTSSNEVEKVGP